MMEAPLKRRPTFTGLHKTRTQKAAIWFGMGQNRIDMANSGTGGIEFPNSVIKDCLVN